MSLFKEQTEMYCCGCISHFCHAFLRSKKVSQLFAQGRKHFEGHHKTATPLPKLKRLRTPPAPARPDRSARESMSPEYTDVQLHSVGNRQGVDTHLDSAHPHSGSDSPPVHLYEPGRLYQTQVISP